MLAASENSSNTGNYVGLPGCETARRVFASIPRHYRSNLEARFLVLATACAPSRLRIGNRRFRVYFFSWKQSAYLLERALPEIRYR